MTRFKLWLLQLTNGTGLSTIFFINVCTLACIPVMAFAQGSSDLCQFSTTKLYHCSKKVGYKSYLGYLFNLRGKLFKIKTKALRH